MWAGTLAGIAPMAIVQPSLKSTKPLLRVGCARSADLVVRSDGRFVDDALIEDIRGVRLAGHQRLHDLEVA